ncbi:MAG TPA: acetyltransferase [Longimicrobiaceae bacterium]
MSDFRKLVVFGNGPAARMAHYYFDRDSEYEVAAFAVDRAYLGGAEEHLGLPLVPFEEVAERYPPSGHDLFVAMGYARMNRARAEKYAEAKAKGYRLASYVSTSCTWLADDPPGDNTMVMEDNTIQPFVRIGSNVVLWSGNHVGHESVIGDHCFLTSHVVVSGFVRVGDYSFLGVNATIRDGVTLAPETLVGAGAVITRDTVERGVYVPPRSVLLDRRSDEIEI